MEKSEISIHEARLFVALYRGTAAWATSKEIAAAACIAERTARAHLLKLSQMGIADAAEVFPGHRYRLSAKADKRNGGYFRRLQTACEVFGIAR